MISAYLFIFSLEILIYHSYSILWNVRAIIYLARKYRKDCKQLVMFDLVLSLG